MKNRSLKWNVFLYFILFSFSILIFLWLFQSLFLKYYYKTSKINELDKALNSINTSYTGDTNQLSENLEKYTYNLGICSEVYINGTISYTTNPFNRRCTNLNDIENKKTINDSKTTFVNNNEAKFQLEISNPKYNINSVIHGLRLADDVVVFSHTSIDPIDSTIKVLRKQFSMITVIIIIFAIILAYFISNKITKPILNLTKNSKELSKGNFNTSFDINTNIQELKDLSNSLNYTKDVLKKNDELRRDLMANVSHDLKTPLTMIKAYSEMVRDITYDDKEKRENDLNIIIDEVDRLNLLVNDILCLSKLESNIEELEYEEFNFSRLVKSIVNRFKIYILTEKYKFKVYCADNIVVKADKQKIEQVIYNLISNAVNYAGDQKNIYITVLNKETNIRVAISDTGKGIDKKELEDIWHKYYKTDKRHKRNFIGTGLGLSIVKNVLDLHNYKYGVVTKKNKGTTFYYNIKKM